MVGKKPINGENHEIQIQCPEIKFYENITLLIQIFCPWQLLLLQQWSRAVETDHIAHRDCSLALFRKFSDCRGRSLS